jgi:hypothetical protein
MTDIRNSNASNKGAVAAQPLILHLAQERFAFGEEERQLRAIAFKRAPGLGHGFRLGRKIKIIIIGAVRAKSLEHDSRCSLEVLTPNLATHHPMPILPLNDPME